MIVSRWEQVLNYAILCLFSIVVLLPAAGLILTALSTSPAGNDYTSLDFGNFATAWTDADFRRYIGSSAIITISTVAAVTVLSVLSGYAFGVLDVPGQRLLFPLLLAGIMIPLEAVIVPLYFDFRAWHLTDSYFGLILAHTGLGMSFGTFWMRALFRSLPRELVDAAQLDGASSWTVLWRVLFPVGRPAIVTLVLLGFMWTWNDYFLALVLVSDPAKQPATLALGAFQGRFASQLNLIAAGAVLISLPVVVLYVAFQRQFIRGVLSGAIRE